MRFSNYESTRRRVERIELPLPVRIEAKDKQTDSWNEITRFQTISSCGAGFAIKRRVQVGQLLLLTAPVPQKLRRYDYSEQQYRIWGLVRYCNIDQKSADSGFRVGVAFIGKNPPLSYHENPSKIYDLVHFNQFGFSELKEYNGEIAKSEIHQELPRQHPRYPIPVEIYLESLDKNKNVIASESTVSENLSLGGAAIFASLNVQIDDFVRVNFMTFNISILAQVRNRRIGEDGMPRLHLQFIDRQFPLEGIE